MCISVYSYILHIMYTTCIRIYYLYIRHISLTYTHTHIYLPMLFFYIHHGSISKMFHTIIMW